MGGFGKQPAGTSNAGWGSPGVAVVQGGLVLQDPLNGGVQTGARRINPVTKDYELDSDYGRILGMGAVPQIVQLAAGTTLGTSAISDLGQQLAAIDRITPNFERRCLSVLTKMLQRAIDLGLVQILGFSSFRAGPKDGLREGQTYGRLRWKDLTTGAEHKEIV